MEEAAKKQAELARLSTERRAAPMPPLLPSSLLLPYSTVLQCSEAVYTEALLYVVAKQAAYPTPTNGLQDSRTAAVMRRRAAHSARCLRSSEHLLGGGTVPSPKYHSLGLPHGAVARRSGALLCSSCH